MHNSGAAQCCKICTQYALEQDHTTLTAAVKKDAAACKQTPQPLSILALFYEVKAEKFRKRLAKKN